MCNAYEIGPIKGKVRATADGGGPTLDDPALAEATRGLRLVRRTDRAPVYVADVGMVPMRWGYERPGLGVVNNTRCENLASPMWKESYAGRRCLIPVAAFYEWSGPKGHKRTHRFTDSAGGLLWAAGIWEESSELGRCFSMLTTAANRLVAPIHNRMPALLGADELELYLEGKLEQFAPPPEMLSVHESANPLSKKPPPDEQRELGLDG